MAEKLSRGFFLVLEGLDGSGKSTAAEKFRTILSKKNIAVELLREPTEKTDASREIRKILKTHQAISDATNQTLLDLFRIDRHWDIERLIKPALQRRCVVILDRYFYSTAAYQGRQASEVESILAGYMNDDKILTPDAILYFDLPLKLISERLSDRSEKEVYETESRLKKIGGHYAQVMQSVRQQKSPPAIYTCDHPYNEYEYETVLSDILQHGN